MAPEAKRLEFAVAVQRDGRAAVEDRAPTRLPAEWSAEHLLLVALARCTVAALSYHCRRVDVALQASAEAHGTVTRRGDGSWGFVDIGVALDVRIDPAPADVPDLLAQAERGCFVGASLLPAPAYSWTVNGEEVSSRAEPS